MAQARKSMVEKSTEEEREEMRKVGFDLPADIDFKLTVYARKLRKSRSQITTECLTELLRGVVVSFRNKVSEAGEPA